MAFTTSIYHPVLGGLNLNKHVPEGLISPMRKEELARDDRSGDTIPTAGLYPSGLASPTNGDLSL